SWLAVCRSCCTAPPILTSRPRGSDHLLHSLACQALFGLTTMLNVAACCASLMSISAGRRQSRQVVDAAVDLYGSDDVSARCIVRTMGGSPRRSGPRSPAARPDLTGLGWAGEYRCVGQPAAPLPGATEWAAFDWGPGHGTGGTALDGPGR